MASRPPEFAALLQMNPLFAGLGGEAVERVAALCRRRQLKTGETLFLKGDEGDALFGIRRGQIRIETGTDDGGRLTLNMLGSGDLFGEIALFKGQTRTADAIAAEDTELFMLLRSDFFAFLEREPKFAVRLIELLCERIRWVTVRMEESKFLPLPARLARRVYELANDFGSDLQISQEQLGVYIGASRESVNRQLQQWRTAGIVDLRRGAISIRDMDKLAIEARLT